MADPVKVKVRGDALAKAMSRTYAFMGVDKYAFMFFDFTADGLTVMATDSFKIHAEPVPLAEGAYDKPVTIAAGDAHVIQQYLIIAGALPVTLVLADEFVGFSSEAGLKLSVPRLDEFPVGWRERMDSMHTTGVSVVLDAGHMKAALAVMPNRFFLHLPEGDRQTVYMRPASSEDRTGDTWVMPMATTEDALNHKEPELEEPVAPQEGGEATETKP